MASLSYPDWMPKSLQSGFSMQPEDRRIASSTVGTSFQSGFGGDVCTAEVSLKLNRLQSHWLEQWERDLIAQGTRWFSFPLWYAGEVHWEQCRFRTRPKLSSVDGLYSSFSFSLYVRRRTELLPDCMVKLFACWPPCFFVQLHGCMQRLIAKAPAWRAEIEERLAVAFAPLFTQLSHVTQDSVRDALAEMTEE